MLLRCRIGWHNYGRWSEPFTKIVVGIFYSIQTVKEFRALKCADCGHDYHRRTGRLITSNEQHAGTHEYVGPVWVSKD